MNELYNNKTKKYKIPSVEALMLYAAYMGKGGTSPDQIKTKLSHIGDWFSTHTNIDPRINRYSGKMHWKLATQLRGLSKQYGKPRKLKIPLTPDKLRLIIAHKHGIKMEPVVLDAFAAALALAVYGLLRVGEYTTPTRTRFNPHLHLRRQDITFGYSSTGDLEYVDVFIKASKTDGLRRSVMKRIFKSCDLITCPVRLLEHYMTRSHSRPKHEPLFFVFNSSKVQYMTRNDINQFIQKGCKAAGLKEHMSSHSCRIGGATALAASGFTEEQIRLLGRWVSDCFRAYTRLVAPFAKAASIAFGNLASTSMNQTTLKSAKKVVDKLRNNPVAALSMETEESGDSDERYE